MYSSSANFQILTYSSLLALRVSKAVHLSSGEPGFMGFDLLNVRIPCLSITLCSKIPFHELFKFKQTTFLLFSSFTEVI